MAKKMVIGIRAWIDFAFRKIFGKHGNEICLISLLNAVLDLPVPIASIVYLNPFSYKEFQDDKLVCVDVKATDQNGRVFVVEVQIVVHESFAKRALYYACKNHSDQLKAGQGYSELKATYTICLLMRSLWKGKDRENQLHHHFRLVERFSGHILEDSIEIHTIELSKYNRTMESVRDLSSLEQWCYWIKYSGDHTADELRELLPDLAFLQATNELVAIQEITQEKVMYDTREKAVRDHESNLIDAMKEGLEEGLEKGREEGKIELIRTLEGLLGVLSSDETELGKLNMKDLDARSESLKEKLRNRI